MLGGIMLGGGIPIIPGAPIIIGGGAWPDEDCS
jgi:hypothetical protein